MIVLVDRYKSSSNHIALEQKNERIDLACALMVKKTWDFTGQGAER